MVIRTKKIQAYNKRHGANALKSVFLKIKRNRNFGKNPLVKVLSPFKVVKASSLNALEKRIKDASKGKRCGRIFIRGNPVQQYSESRSRIESWRIAPRGHLDMKTGKISWDSTPSNKTFKNYEFLLYATRPQNQISKKGRITLERYGKSRYCTLLIGNQTQRFSDFEIKGRDALEKQLNVFVKELVKQGYVSGFSQVNLRFVRWKGEKGVEFFDFRGQR